jgi:hypothetical protein
MQQPLIFIGGLEGIRKEKSIPAGRRCRSWFICRESAEFDIYREDLPFGRFRGKMWYDF